MVHSWPIETWNKLTDILNSKLNRASVRGLCSSNYWANEKLVENGHVQECTQLLLENRGGFVWTLESKTKMKQIGHALYAFRITFVQQYSI